MMTDNGKSHQVGGVATMISQQSGVKYSLVSSLELPLLYQ